MAGGASSAGFDDDDGGGIVSDINVTPLVDITLVLLIIMMVTAPMIVNNPSIKVELPKAASGEETQKSTLAITLRRDGTIYFGTFNGRLWAVNPNGTKKWVFRAGREIKSSPAIGADGIIYFGCRDLHCPTRTRESWVGTISTASPSLRRSLGRGGTRPYHAGASRRVLFERSPSSRPGSAAVSAASFRTPALPGSG